jgi:dTDP-4-amino-4,6-dideoxy-D-galactose acyltransferase
MNNADELSSLLRGRIAEMTYYSPFSFLRHTDPVTLCRGTFTEPLLQSVNRGEATVTAETVNGRTTFIVWKYLPWDSEHFHRRVFRIELVASDHGDTEAIAVALKSFLGTFTERSDYLFITVPCEDLPVLHALSYAGFRMVETRLNYYFPGFTAVEDPELPLRMAVEDDIPVLRKIVMTRRNRYDRVHADPAFTEEEADNYLGTFAGQCVRGFADIVMVPDIPGVKPFGFLAANNPQRIMGLNIAKLVLAAVDNREYKGWLAYLLQGVMYELKKRDTDVLTTITQASNRPAIRTWENAGFTLGFVNHVYTYSVK